MYWYYQPYLCLWLDGKFVGITKIKEKTMEYGRKILAAIEAGAGEVYVEIEARTSFPDRDKSVLLYL